MRLCASAASNASKAAPLKTACRTTTQSRNRTATSANKYTTVLTKDDKFMRKLCMNCEDPACASVCPVGALKKTSLGPVTYDKHKCMGCRYCMAACPFGVPKYEWDKAIPGVRKCIMCAPRVAAGKPTACAEICPTGATKFGEREELLKEAHKRIQDNPGNYLPHIYGETEVGGTSVFLLSSIDFQKFGYRDDLTAARAAHVHLPGAFAHSRLCAASSAFCWAAFIGSPIAAKMLPKPKRRKNTQDEKGGAQ